MPELIIAAGAILVLLAGVLILFLAGVAQSVSQVPMAAMLLRTTGEEFRGRVMSIYVLMFLGMAPFGNFEIGYLTEHFGIGTAFALNAAVVLLFGAVIFFNRKRISARYQDYKVKNNLT